MASYSGARSQHQTLSTNTVDTVTLDGDYDTIELINRATSGDIYFTVDGTVPTVGGAGTYIARAGDAVQLEPDTSGKSVVKLISSSACAYTVAGI